MLKKKAKTIIAKPHPWGTFPAEWIPAGQTPAYKRSTSQASCQGGPALPSVEGEKKPKKKQATPEIKLNLSAILKEGEITNDARGRADPALQICNSHPSLKETASRGNSYLFHKLQLHRAQKVKTSSDGRSPFPSNFSMKYVLSIFDTPPVCKN